MLEHPPTQSASSVRWPIWQGQLDVAALWLPADWLSTGERIERLLHAWQAGSRALRYEDGDLLCFASPQRMHCAQAPGVPMCQLGTLLCSAPLDAAELQTLPAADLALVQGAQVLCLRFDQGQVLDLAESLDISAMHLLPCLDWATQTVRLHSPLAGADTRELLGDAIPPPSAEQTAFLASLAGKTPNGSADTTNSDGPFRRLGKTMAQGLIQALLNQLPWRLLGAGGDAQEPSGEPGGIAPRQEPNLPTRWHQRLMQLGQRAGLGRLLGRQHAAFMQHMLDLFEQGKLDEALRHAIPLNGSDGQSLGQTLSTLQRRAKLTLSSGAPGMSSSVIVSDNLHEHLQRLYRRSFEQLDRLGRVDEALYVLAELLGARQEALDYLTKHQRFKQAAQLALQWDMPAETLIRLLLQASEPERAVLVARRDNAFASAVQQLQGPHPQLADDLRLAWGHALVQSGNWLEAVNVVWPVPKARQQAAQWLLAAEQAGHSLSARALVQRATLLPDTLDLHAPWITAMAGPAQHGEVASQRQALAQALLGIQPAPQALRNLAMWVLPALVGDQVEGRSHLNEADMNRLLGLSADPFYASDAPRHALARARTRESLWQRSEALQLHAPEAGLHAIHDAVLLPDQRHLLALGEAGLALLDARGRVAKRYAIPADRLVLADSGHVVLAIAQREQVSRITRLDLVSHASTELGNLRLRFFAPSFGLPGWTVVIEQRIVVMDVGGTAPEVLWQVSNLPGPIEAAAFLPDREHYLIGMNGQRSLAHGPEVDGELAVQLWRYVLPGRRLQPVSAANWRPNLPACFLSDTLQQPFVSASQGALWLDTDWRDAPIQLQAPGPGGAFHSSVHPLTNGLTVGLHEPSGSRLFVMPQNGQHSVATVDWPAGAELRVRQCGDVLLVHDDQGRLLHLNTADSSVRHISVQ